MIRRFVFVVLIAASLPALAQDPLAEHGCLGCHSVDGSSGAGPTLAGIAEDRDEAYLRRALVDPAADVPDGYAAMPDLQLDDESVELLVETMTTLMPRTPPFEAMWPLALACALFVFGHFFFSGPVRTGLVRRLGEAKFQGLYSLLAALPFAGIFWGWSVAPHVPLWMPPTFTTHLTVTLMLFAVFFLVAGYSTPSPTMAGVAMMTEPKGIQTVTRHPALWGFALWSISHLSANGDLASIVLFGSFLVLSIGGMLHIDARRRRSGGDKWESYRSKTSVIPFGAIVTGRTKIDLRGWAWRFVLSLVVYVSIVMWSHEWLTGVPALPMEMQRLLPG